MLPERHTGGLVSLPATANALLDAIAGHLSPRTRAEYLRDLRAFLRWYAPNAGDIEALRALLSLSPLEAHKVVADYRAHLRAQNRKPTTINRALAAIRAIWGALWAAGVVPYRLSVRGEPNRTDPRTRVAQRLPAQSLPALQALLQGLAKPQGDSPETLRDALAVGLLGLAGLRRVELQRLTWGALNGDALHVLGKGGKERLVPLSPHIVALWNSYRAALRGLGIPAQDGDAVFVACSPYAMRHWGKPLSLQMLNYITNKALQAANAKRKGLSCHSLRHAFATIAVQHAPIVDLAAHLGHSNIATTGLYAHALGKANLSAIVATQAGLAPTPTSAPKPQPKPAVPVGLVLSPRNFRKLNHK